MRDEEHKSRREMGRALSNLMYRIENIQTSRIILCPILPIYRLACTLLVFLIYFFYVDESNEHNKMTSNYRKLYLIEMIVKYESRNELSVTETGIISISMSRVVTTIHIQICLFCLVTVSARSCD